CPGSGSLIKSENGRGNDPMPAVAWAKALEKVPGKLTEADLLEAPFVQLFDLSADPHEDKNLAQENPDRVRRMVTLLKDQIASGRSTPGPELKNDKNVRIVYTRDRRLPAFVRERME
ncbi:MAG: hypothetical protein OSA95_07555, partial [Opitutales bacterium]|nr:hypothetical protein [Opitutales bacterium]